MSTHRLERVASLLQQELSRLILDEELKDPRINKLVAISGVTVSKDLEYAKVRVSGYLTHKKLEKAVAGLNSAAGFIQGRLAKRLRFRATPKLTFLVDHSIEEGFELTQKIDEIVS